jgi:transposase
MCYFRFTISASYRKEVEGHLKTAQHLGHLRQVKYLLTILAVLDGQSFAQVALVLRVHEKTVATWVHGFCCYGIQGAPRTKPTGRPPKLTPTQKAALATLIEEGPVKAGCSGACWRSPMIQQLIYDRFGVFSNVFYIAQLLKNLGFSYQKAAFISDHLDERKRQEWRTTTWPQILRKAQAQKALLLFGDEASFPQWGTLTYTWARRGQQPLVKTSGKRKGYKVFGVIDYFTGCFFYHGLFLLSRARRPSEFCSIHCLPHTCAGAHHTIHLPDSGWGKVSHQRGDQSLFRPTDRPASGVPAADLFTRLQPD